MTCESIWQELSQHAFKREEKIVCLKLPEEIFFHRMEIWAFHWVSKVDLNKKSCYISINRLISAAPGDAK